MPFHPLKIDLRFIWNPEEFDLHDEKQFDIIKRRTTTYLVAVFQAAADHQRKNPEWRQRTLFGIQRGLLEQAKLELESKGRENWGKIGDSPLSEALRQRGGFDRMDRINRMSFPDRSCSSCNPV